MTDYIKKMLDSTGEVKKALTSANVKHDFSFEDYLEANGNMESFTVVDDPTIKVLDPRITRVARIEMPWESNISKSIETVECGRCGYMYSKGSECKCASTFYANWSK
jgi:hypothetical protein